MIDPAPSPSPRDKPAVTNPARTATRVHHPNRRRPGGDSAAGLTPDVRTTIAPSLLTAQPGHGADARHASWCPDTHVP